MISAWELYLWTRLDSLSFAFWIVTAITSVMYIKKSMSAAIDKDIYSDSTYPEGKEKYRIACDFFRSKLFKVVPCVLGALFFLSILIPSQKDMAMIWIVPQLATVENAELLQGEAAEIYKLAKQALTESLDLPEGTND